MATTSIVVSNPKPVRASGKRKRAKAKAKARRRAAKRSARTLTIANVPNPMALVHRVCSITDPFCHHAKGAMYPDASANNVLTEQLRFMWTPTNDAAGNTFLAFQANPLFPFISGTRTGSTWATSGTYTAIPYTSMLATYGATARVVTWGVRVINTASATNSSGYVNMYTSGEIVPGADVTQSVSQYSRSLTAPLSHGSQYCFISRPGGAGARTFRALTSYTSTYSDTDWESVIFTTWGAPASVNSLVFEFIMNVEYTLGNSTHVGQALASLAKQSPPENRTVIQAASKVQSQADTLVAKPMSETSKAFLRTAKEVALRAIGAGVGALAGSYAGGPQGTLTGGSLGYGAGGLLNDIIDAD